MVSDKDKCFRLRGIPKDFGERQIQDILAEEFFPCGNVDIEVHSLACNPVREKEWIATLSFSEIPVSLAQQPNYFIDIPRSRCQLYLDTHFEGFTPLHATTDDQCDIDVVAISGLNGHAFGSFKQTGRKRMWLRDDLPSDFTQARIFVYGYDTSPRSHSFQNISDIADTFRKTLAALRRTPPQRPLVFIAHSLGGIVLKSALNTMVDSQEGQDKLNISSLRALFFFGVPNQGMNVESLIAMNPDITNRRIIYALDNKNSAELRVISERFTRSFRNTVTVNFYETLKSPTAERQADGSWAMSGPEEILVSTDSATQGKVFDDGPHFVFQVQSTHSNMVKLNGVHDHVYEHVRHRLIEVIEDLGSRDTAPESHLSTEDMDACLQSLWFPEQNDRQLQATDPAEGTCGWILEAFEFQQWHEAYSGFLWILGHPGTGKSTLMKYVLGWKQNQHQNNEVIASFFVHGRGKSEMQYSLLGLYRTLLHQVLQQLPKHLSNLARTYKSYCDSRGNHGLSWTWSEQELCRFFFDIIAEEAPNRPITLLIDALDEIESTRTDSLPNTARKLIADLAKFTDDRVLGHARGNLKIMISCRYYPIIHSNSGLSISIEKENKQDIGILIESHQALNEIEGEDQSIKQIIVERANGIFQWVAVVLEEVTRLHQKGESFKNIKRAIETVPQTLQDLYNFLILSGGFDERRQALKLFTWLIFAARPLSLAEYRDALAVDAAMEHRSFGQLSEAKDFRNLNAMEKIVHNISRGLVQVQKNQRPKNPRFNPEFYPKSETRLVDPTYDGRWQTLQLMHQSVLDFLKKEGLSQLADSTGNSEFSAQWELSRSCIKYLLLEEIMSRPFERNEAKCTKEEFEESVAIPLAFDFALTEYAHSFWLLHVMKAEEDNVDQRDLLQLSGLKSRNGYLPDSCNLRLTYGSPFYFVPNYRFYRIREPVSAEPTFKRYRMLVRKVDSLFQFWNSHVDGMGEQFSRALLQHPSRLTLVELLLLAGVKIPVLKIKEVQRGSLKCESTAYLLQYACLGRRQDIVDWILENVRGRELRRMLNPDAEPTICLPLTIAVIQNHWELVQRLLKAGAIIDAVTFSGVQFARYGVTALGMAAQQGNIRMIKLLLDGGADPMSMTFIDGLYSFTQIATSHFAAALGGHDVGVELLLEPRYGKGLVRKLAVMRPVMGDTTLIHICHTGAIIKTLLDHGADPNAKDMRGETPLHIHSGSFELVRLLLRYDGNPCILDKQGRSPLQRSADESDEAFHLMFNWTDSSLRSAPMLNVMACREKPPDKWPWEESEARMNCTKLITKALIQYGTSLDHDWNKQDKEGCTLLSVAVEHNIPEIVDILLDSGRVDFRVADKKGITPLEKAIRYGYHTVTEILKRYLEMNPMPYSNEVPSSVAKRRMDPVPRSTENWAREARPVSSSRKEHNFNALDSDRRQRNKGSSLRERDQQAGQRAEPARQSRHHKRS